MIDVIIAGATGWAGSELARAGAKSDDFALLVTPKVAALTGVHRGRDGVPDL